MSNYKRYVSLHDASSQLSSENNINYILMDAEEVFLPKEFEIGHTFYLKNMMRQLVIIKGINGQQIQWPWCKKRFNLIKAKKGLILGPLAELGLICYKKQGFRPLSIVGEVRERK